jgi:hypothetical protein
MAGLTGGLVNRELKGVIVEQAKGNPKLYLDNLDLSLDFINSAEVALPG